jgi:hypothetical protein
MITLDKQIVEIRYLTLFNLTLFNLMHIMATQGEIFRSNFGRR